MSDKTIIAEISEKFWKQQTYWNFEMRATLEFPVFSRYLENISNFFLIRY